MESVGDDGIDERSYGGNGGLSKPLRLTHGPSDGLHSPLTTLLPKNNDDIFRLLKQH